MNKVYFSKVFDFIFFPSHRHDWIVRKFNILNETIFFKQTAYHCKLQVTRIALRSLHKFCFFLK